MRETIRLGEGDGVAVARSKLQAATARHVALVLPPGNHSLRSRVDLTLIRRAAEGLSLDLVVVTGDAGLADLARSAGLRVVRSEGRALRTGAERARKAEPPRRMPAVRADIRASAARGSMPSRRQGVLALAGALVATLLLLVGCALLLPGATVALDPVGNRASAEAEIVASADVRGADPAQGGVPLRQVEIEVPGEETGQATGRKAMPDQHASGEVVLANKSTEAVTVAKGTVVRTTDGEPVRFYTLLDVEVPGSYGAVARVPIMAFEPGPIGNVEALTIRAVEGEAGHRVEVLNDQPVRGGTEKRASIVAQEDQDRLRATLMQRLQQEAYDLLVSQLAAGEWVPPDTLEVSIVEEAFDRQVDEPAETLRLAMLVRVTGLAVDGQATRQLMARRLEAQDGAQWVVNDATLRVEQPVGQVDVAGPVVRFRARASAMLVEPVDQREIGRQLAGQDPQSALDWLNAHFDLRQPPEIRTSPSWWRRLPWLPTRIRIELSGGL